MYLPNSDFAIVELEKLRNYCLNPEHPQGKHKARVFATALGITVADAERLRDMLLSAARTDQASVGERDEFGQRYVLDFVVFGATELVTIRSAWIVRSSEETPRLVTCYVL